MLIPHQDAPIFNVDDLPKKSTGHGFQPSVNIL